MEFAAHGNMFDGAGHKTICRKSQFGGIASGRALPAIADGAAEDPDDAPLVAEVMALADRALAERAAPAPVDGPTVAPCFLKAGFPRPQPNPSKAKAPAVPASMIAKRKPKLVSAGKEVSGGWFVGQKDSRWYTPPPFGKYRGGKVLSPLPTPHSSFGPGPGRNMGR